MPVLVRSGVCLHCRCECTSEICIHYEYSWCRFDDIRELCELAHNSAQSILCHTLMERILDFPRWHRSCVIESHQAGQMRPDVPSLSFFRRHEMRKLLMLGLISAGAMMFGMENTAKAQCYRGGGFGGGFNSGFVGGGFNRGFIGSGFNRGFSRGGFNRGFIGGRRSGFSLFIGSGRRGGFGFRSGGFGRRGFGRSRGFGGFGSRGRRW